jgi:hypothetical protein
MKDLIAAIAAIRKEWAKPAPPPRVPQPLPKKGRKYLHAVTKKTKRIRSIKRPR